MCEYCEGVQGHAMIDNGSFTVRLMPRDGRLGIDHECGRSCDLSYDFCSIPVNHCPMCGRDLRGGRA
ncbi:hypothetical protein VJ923_06090 [Adlercreutzia sp. R25]|uniref:Uncharacterized protein n=1 Tax=Adlercreutzia shanghongiae TaxID=3111773 RepID=A0ABU6IWZ2_9ACTN|nr:MULTISPECIES: hypothetical protein [unclassified Adlercreutzia]MEC4272722.1 hypothetical protein [Adlercreutzia sp. R25]MEC4294379.1 hypothetical protein [Adlercreutzia sp. R22]